jgi:hypothetical protein
MQKDLKQKILHYCKMYRYSLRNIIICVGNELVFVLESILGVRFSAVNYHNFHQNNKMIQFPVSISDPQSNYSAPPVINFSFHGNR